MYKFFEELELDELFMHDNDFYEKVSEYDAKSLSTGDVDAVLSDEQVIVLDEKDD